MDVIWYKTDILHIFCAIALIFFIILVLFCACIYTEKFSKYNAHTLCNVAIRNNIQNYSDFSQLFIVKNVNMSFLNIMLCYYLSLEAALQSMAKNNPTVKQIDAEIQVTLKHGPAWKLKVYRYKLQRQI